MGIKKGGIEEAYELEMSGEYELALKKYKEISGTYKDKALYRIGQMYRKGSGCQVNYPKAINIFMDLARRGNVDGEYMVGLMYFEGEGVVQDYKKAMFWHQRAGNQGLKYAQYSVGIMYENGWGCKENAQKAYEWYKRAADQEYGTAQYRVACHYYFGLSVKRDIDEAKKWFQKSSKNGFTESKYNLACILLEENDCTEAVSLLKEAVASDHLMAAYNLYLCAVYGIGMDEDLDYARSIGEFLSVCNKIKWEKKIKLLEE